MLRSGVQQSGSPRFVFGEKRTRVVVFRRLGKALGQAPLGIELPSSDHLYLLRVSLEETTPRLLACFSRIDRRTPGLY